MAGKCPNKKSPEYRYLVSKVGQVEAIRIWMANGEETPSIAESIDLIEKLQGAKKEKFIKQKQLLENQIRRKKNDLKKYSSSDSIYKKIEAEIESQEEKLAKAVGSQLEVDWIAIGKEVLIDIQNDLTAIEQGNTGIVTDNWFNYIRNTIDAWSSVPGTMDDAAFLRRKLNVLIEENIVNEVNKYANKSEKITLQDIDSQDQDVGLWSSGTGSLVDSINYIAKTIGLKIRAAQNDAEVAKNKNRRNINNASEALEEYSKSSGIDMDAIWELLTEEKDGTLELVSEFTDEGDLNTKFDFIRENPILLKFHTFYKEANINMDKNPYFIANIAKTSIKSWLTSISPFKERKVGAGNEEDTSLDLVPHKFNSKMSVIEKNSNLALALLAYSNHHEEQTRMADILPGVRLMQEHLKYNKSDDSKEKQFRSSTNPNVKINATKTNLWNHVDKWIEMQVIGKMKKSEGQIVTSTKIDSDGNVKQEYIDTRLLGDNMLKYYSLVRIGFSPIGALANVTFGDMSNAIEAIGGRFFGVKELHQASIIFGKQFRDENSALNNIHEELNFLQELDDYEYMESVKNSGKKAGLTGEKLQEYMYSLQKGGENWIQSRSAMAIMIRDEYMTSEGVLTKKYSDASTEEKQRLTDKIQRINHLNHGRYNTKESAIWSQNILYRAASQFRKWIPSAIEQRIGEYNPHDTRLGVDTEGRYRTFGREVLSNLLKDPKLALENLVVPIISAKEALEKGNLTEMEIANIRKMVAEMVMITATIVLTMGLKGGSDEDRKKRMKNPVIKFILTLLNRISGDLLFFYKPSSVSDVANSIIPAMKLVTDLEKAVDYAIRLYPLYLNDWEYKHGSNKGRNKFYKTVAGEIPFIKSIQDVYRMANDRALEELAL